MRFVQLVLVFLLLFSGSLLAQPEIEWSNPVGSDNPDYCFSIQPTNDWGYILAGKTVSSDQDFLLIKCNSSGIPQWTQTYGGEGNEWCYSVTQTDDGGYLLGGYVQHLGTGEHDIWIIKTDDSGEVEWDRTYGGNSHDVCYAVMQTSDGGYLIGGQTDSFADYDQFYAIKTDSEGDTLWTRVSNVGDWCRSVHQTSDGGYVLGGGGWQGMCVVRLSPMGNVIWDQFWRDGSYNDDGYSVNEDLNGDIIVAGKKGNLNPNLYMTKTSAEGDTLWSRIYGENAVDHCYSMVVTGGGNYILAGYTTSYGQPDGAMLLMKTDTDGDEIWVEAYPGESTIECRTVHQTWEGGFILGGTLYSLAGDDFYLMKVGLDGTGVEDRQVSVLPSGFELSQPYPNPFNPSTTLYLDLVKTHPIAVNVYDILGKKVDVLVSGVVDAGHHKLVFEGSELPAGTYLVRAEGREFGSQSRKVILLK